MYRWQYLHQNCGRKGTNLHTINSQHQTDTVCNSKQKNGYTLFNSILSNTLCLKSVILAWLNYRYHSKRKIPGLSRTSIAFQGLSRPGILLFKLKDFSRLSRTVRTVQPCTYYFGQQHRSVEQQSTSSWTTKSLMQILPQVSRDSRLWVWHLSHSNFVLGSTSLR